ncbi:MAG TPA: insulinase family protein, partial [Vicinamibacterales bacterium]|nr:insulinase family protein [Vicinamibacterales bacterium]
MLERSRRFAIVALLTVASALALHAQGKAGADNIRIPFETYALPNGLRVVLAPDSTTPTVAVNVWYHVGSKNETPGRTGFAHLFEHLMFQGSESLEKLA